MHIPVLLKEVIQYLNPESNKNFIDCTLGFGGHGLAILEKTEPNGKLLGIDADCQQMEKSKLNFEKFKKRIIFACDNFSNLKEIAKKENYNNVSGILLDLGMSSNQLDESKRGFSFQKRERLDMRFNAQNQLTAEKIVNYWSFQEIENILKEYGEEQFSVNIAKNIAESRKERPIESTLQLVQIIEKSVPGWYRRGRLNPATKTFQALRIAVNDELNNLKNVLPQALEILEPEGRIAVISFHSLEDRIVKNFFRDKAKEASLKIFTKKPIAPSPEEIKNNPRSRSAKLRAAVKI